MQDIALRDRVRAAETEIANGHPDQALAHCQALQARYPQALIVQRLLGEIYLALNRPVEALRTMEWVVAVDPEDARACCALAIAEQMRGDARAALAWYRQACEIRPEDNMLRQAYRELAATRSQPAYQLSSAGLARLYLRGDLLLHAQTEWEAVLAQHPDHLDALVGLAETYWRSGQSERARSCAQQVVDRTPLCIRALLILCAIDHAAGRADEARTRMQLIADLDPEQRIGHALYAEQLAAGDEGLGRLLLAPPSGAAANFSSSQAGGLNSGAMRGISHTDVMRAQQSAPRSGALPLAAQEDLDAVNSFGQKRSAPIPDDFHSIFAETEFMLWGRDDDEAGRPSAPQTGPAPFAPATNPLAGAELPRLARTERGGSTAPPPSHHHDSNLEDTESRAAIGWIRWLQAQGARPLATPDVHPPASETHSAPTPISQPGPFAAPPLADQPTSSEPVAGMPRGDEVAAAQWRVGEPAGDEVGWAQPPANVEAVHDTGDVWAGAQHSAAESVDEDTVLLPSYPPGAASEEQGAPDPMSFGEVSPGRVSSPLWPADASADPASAQKAWPREDGLEQLPDTAAADDGPSARAFAQPYDAPDSSPADEPHGADAAEMPDEVTTLDALEAADRGAGFTAYEPHPGDLAAIAGARDDVALEPEDRPVSPLDWPDVPPVEQVLDAAGNGEAEADALSSEEADARLRLAREHRDHGRLEDALSVYGVLLQHAPAQLEAVTRDLQEIVAETEAPAAHRLLGDAYIRGGEYQQALAAYNQANTTTSPPEQ